MTLRRLRPAVPLVVPTVHGWWLLALALALGVSWRLTDLGLMRSAAVLLACLAAVAALGALLLGAASRSLVRIAGPDQVVAGESGRWQAVLAPRIPPWVQGELRMRVGGLGASLSLFAPPPGPTAPGPPAPVPGVPAPAPGSGGGGRGETKKTGKAAHTTITNRKKKKQPTPTTQTPLPPPLSPFTPTTPHHPLAMTRQKLLPPDPTS